MRGSRGPFFCNAQELNTEIVNVCVLTACRLAVKTPYVYGFLVVKIAHCKALVSHRKRASPPFCVTIGEI